MQGLVQSLDRARDCLTLAVTDGARDCLTLAVTDASFFADVLTFSSLGDSGFDRMILGGTTATFPGGDITAFLAVGVGDERRGAPRLIGSGGGPLGCFRGVDKRCMLRSMSVRLRRDASLRDVDVSLPLDDDESVSWRRRDFRFDEVFLRGVTSSSSWM